MSGHFTDRAVMIVLGFLCILIWTYLLGFHGEFWRVRTPVLFRDYRSLASIAVVIPARNEAEGIGRTVRSLLTQHYAGPINLIVVDDHSSDGTAERARAAAGNEGERLTIVSGTELPAGWTGKLWAVSQGVARAVELNPDFILLTDGDIEHGADSLNQLVARAETQALDLASVMVRLHCKTAAERTFIPAFVFFFFMLYPPSWAADPTRRQGGAAGGCMLVRPAALNRIGGINTIRDALIDDCALAAAIKRSGGRIHLDVTDATHSTRIYQSASEIWSMIARTAFTQLRYSVWLLIGTVFGLFLTYLCPPLLVVFGHGSARLLGATAWIGMAIAFIPTLKLYRRSLIWGFALPGIAAFYAAATIASAFRYWSGRGGEWKGRRQAINLRGSGAA